MFAVFGDGTPTIPNPNVFTESTLTQNRRRSGAFTQRLPLDIPPGRNGLQPDVTLDYNSQRTQDSIVGYGWQLSIPYIQRLNKTGSQNLYSAARRTSPRRSMASSQTSTHCTHRGNDIPIHPRLPSRSPSTKRRSARRDSRSYTVPAGGSNKLFLVLLANGNYQYALRNPQRRTAHLRAHHGSVNRAYYFVGYLANPTSGTFTMNWSPGTNADYTLLTVTDAAQTNPIDASNVTTVNPGTTSSTSVTTTQGNDLLLSFPVGSSASPHSPASVPARHKRSPRRIRNSAHRRARTNSSDDRGHRDHDDQHLRLSADG